MTREEGTATKKYMRAAARKQHPGGPYGPGEG